jgi:acetylglutamate kinase
MTDVPGVLRDKSDVSTMIHELNIRQCRTLIQEGVIAGGMIPKASTSLLCDQMMA